MTRGRDLALAVNGFSGENDSNTPDFVLGEFLSGVLDCFADAVEAREQWYGVHHEAAVFRETGGIDFSDLTVEEAVFQAIGAGSTAWVGGTGDAVFDEKHATNVANALLNRLSVAKDDR